MKNKWRTYKSISIKMAKKIYKMTVIRFISDQ